MTKTPPTDGHGTADRRRQRETCDLGHDGGSPVTSDYSQNGGSTFSGTVNWVEFDAGIAADDQNHLITSEERLQVAMSRQ